MRRRRSGAEGARLVAEFERSGLGRKEFCAAHGLNVHTLDAWRRRVASSASEEQMVPVEIVAEHTGMRPRRAGVMERRTGASGSLLWSMSALRKLASNTQRFVTISQQKEPWTASFTWFLTTTCCLFWLAASPL